MRRRRAVHKSTPCRRILLLKSVWQSSCSLISALGFASPSRTTWRTSRAAHRKPEQLPESNSSDLNNVQRLAVWSFEQEMQLWELQESSILTRESCIVRRGADGSEDASDGGRFLPATAAITDQPEASVGAPD